MTSDLSRPRIAAERRFGKNLIRQRWRRGSGRASRLLIGQSVSMDGSAESVVRSFLASWSNPEAEHLASYFAEDAVWVDGPNGVHSGSSAIVDELVRQLTIPSESWIEIDTLLADDGTVMVEWHGQLTIGATYVETKVMAVFEVDRSGRITQMRESFDMKSLVDQIASEIDRDS